MSATGEVVVSAAHALVSQNRAANASSPYLSGVGHSEEKIISIYM